MKSEQIDDIVKDLKAGHLIKPPSRWQTASGTRYLFGLTLTAGGLISGGYQYWLAVHPVTYSLPNSAQLASALFTVAAIIFAYAQWLNARREASLDKFYERLSLINSRYHAWPEARMLTKHFWYEDHASVDPSSPDAETEFKKSNYVYLEYDNLEYMISRYQLGFVTEELLKRAIWTFVARCEVGEFATIAKRLALKAEGGYNANTGKVVEYLLGRVLQFNTRRS